MNQLPVDKLRSDKLRGDKLRGDKLRGDKLRIDVWSDIACPWCYVGKRRLEAALALFQHGRDTEIVWHAFELDPSAPRERDRGQSYAARLAQKYGASLAEGEAMIARMVDVAHAEGLSFDFARMRPGNTFDAHRLLAFAAERGLKAAMKERFLRAYFVEGEAIGDPEALARLAGEVGGDAGGGSLTSDEARAVLASDRYRDDVRADEAEAARLGIRGVPFFVLGGRYALSGAQPAKVLLGALEQTWRDVMNRPDTLESVEPGEACGPDGCADT